MSPEQIKAVIGEERRKQDSLALRVMEVVLAQNTEISKQLTTVAQDLATYRSGTTAELERIASGFPDDDPAGHCAAHRAQIRAANKKEKFYDTLQLKLAEKGAWGAFLLLLSLIVAGLLAKLKGINL